MDSLQKLQKLNDICLFVDDFQGSLRFYVEKFGFKVIRLQPDPEHANYAQFDFNGTAVTLWQKDGVIEAMGSKALGEYGHHFMLAVKVPQLQDVDDIYSELTSRAWSAFKSPPRIPSAPGRPISWTMREISGRSSPGRRATDPACWNLKGS